MSDSAKNLKLINARENNLKDLTLEIPHDRLTVVTGLSGSGKSSLAFDTVYAEGQRRYIETFSPYTRQFFDKVKKPDLDAAQNVRPAVAIQQRTRITNSRSTVGSITNVNDYLKILWSNLATPVCPVCSIELKAWSAPELAQHLVNWQRLKPKSTFLVCARLTLTKSAKTKPSDSAGRRPKRGKLSKTSKQLDAAAAATPLTQESLATQLTALGFSRVFDDSTGAIESLDNPDAKHPLNQEQLILVLDRVRPGAAAGSLKRLRDSIDQAYGLQHQKLPPGSAADGKCCIIELPESAAPSNQFSARQLTLVENTPAQLNHRAPRFQQREFAPFFCCPSNSFTIQNARPALFSFNHPIGACPECKGFGKILEIDPELVVPNPTLSLKQNALQCWSGKAARIERKDLFEFCGKHNISTETPWQDLPAEQKELIFNHKSKEYWGVRPWFKWLERKIYKMHVRVFLSRYRSQKDCPSCQGTRLKRDALAFRVSGRTLPEIWNMPIGELLTWIKGVHAERTRRAPLPRALNELFIALEARLEYLVNLGLPYLTLERQARTLSGGETQRVNLATALGSDLISTQFVLDEPSVGLHARDTERLIGAVRNLTDRGNSLLVVEHDLECINAADQIIELGPEAGERGGEIVFNGSAKDWPGIDRSNEQLPVALPQTSFDQQLIIRSANARNLKDLNLTLPLGRFVCLTGVSGSGKSTLINEVIQRSWNDFKLGIRQEAAQVLGFEQLEQLLLVDQTPLAKSPRANIATYSGIWDSVRNLLTETPDAQTRALARSAFSFNVEGGRCPACKGAGYIREDMQFLSDVYVQCEVCLGQRFQQAVLEVKYRTKNVAEILNLTVHACLAFFKDQPQIVRIAEVLDRLGLGHLTLGHALSDLSGGEAQRLKLVPFIEQSGHSRALLIFDEPTTGLHYRDVQRLIALFKMLRDKGHSVLCVEHNLSLIMAADWLIDLGPEGGAQGGYLVKEGTPSDFLLAGKESASYTARYLAQYAATLKAPRQRQPLAKFSRPIQPSEIIIKGAREHNLKEIDVRVPLNQLVALTGVSGSGKSTIAKDIIYAEGQRRYLDCLSPYARQYIKELHKPDIDELKNIKPTICVYQHTFQPSRLSSVATMSEVYNFLRLLFAKSAEQFCPDHPEHSIQPYSASDIAQEIKKIKAKNVRVLAPVVKSKKGNHKAVFERAAASEITQLRVDGIFLNTSAINTAAGLEKNKVHTIEFIVGKFNPAQLPLDLIEEAVRQALSLSAGMLIVHSDAGELSYSTERACPICKRGFFKPDPEDLSFNSKRGRCEKCSGSGELEGQPCPSCQGARINALGRNLRLQGKTIYDLTMLTAPELEVFLTGLNLSTNKQALAQPIIRELKARLATLSALGLNHLELARDCSTISNGELQRLRLATAMGSDLSGVLYIFDEPSVGLHPLDNRLVLARLQSLKDDGNSIIMIEHDPESILSADYVLDVGPGGGRSGGEIVFSGPVSEFANSADSPTARAFRTSASAAAPTLKSFKKNPALTISSGCANNIRNLNLTLPLNSLTVIAGVSGAGKSSLLHGIIAESLLNKLDSQTTWKGARGVLHSDIELARLIEVDQKPIGINSRSTPASYLKVWDEIRKLFASNPEARLRGWNESFFSYNSGKGRCAECGGTGQIKLEMSFLPDAEVVCESCGGGRFSEDANSIRYLGFSPSEVLRLTFEEAKQSFANHRRIHRALHLACELGLGYLTLGQSSTTLSGGESQRIKLVSELSTTRKGHTIYILDEPTTGLHKTDVGRLVKTLKELVARGNSVFVIEHDVDVILAADQLIELGPGPGVQGGKVIFSGAPGKLAQANTPWSRVLRESKTNYGIKPAANDLS